MPRSTGCSPGSEVGALVARFAVSRIKWCFWQLLSWVNRDNKDESLRVLACADKGEFVIDDIEFDVKHNKVIVSGPFDPDKLADKLCCKACKIIKEIEIVDLPPPPPPPAPEPEPEPPKKEEPQPPPPKEEEKPEPPPAVIIVEPPAPAPEPGRAAEERAAAAAASQAGACPPPPKVVEVPYPGPTPTRSVVAVRLLLPPWPRRLPLLLLREGAGAGAGAGASAAAVHPLLPAAAALPLRRLQDRLRGGPLLRLRHHVT